MNSQLSFVVYFHPSRTDNLQQMLRLMLDREPVCRESELVLVCQDQCNIEVGGFSRIKKLNLRMNTYNKAVMCNRGVGTARGKVIALLDSDRILPPNWFLKASKTAAPGRGITAAKLITCTRPHSDEEIKKGRIRFTPDLKCAYNLPFSKNEFSGNTVMLKEDYLRVGGMDEEFFSYGFTDNDMAEKCYRSGVIFEFWDDLEIHLYHPKSVVVEGEEVPRSHFRLYTLYNGFKYCLKWGKLPTPLLMDLFRTVRQEFPDSPLMDEIVHNANRLRVM